MKSFIAIACLLTMMTYAANATPTPKRAGSVRECCKILLINWDNHNHSPVHSAHNNHTYLNQMSGTRNGHPKWSSREGGDSIIYYEKSKWIIAGERRQPMGISNTSPKCPEMVQKWSPGPENVKNLPLVGGKIRCAVEDQALERCLQDTNDCKNVQI